MKYLEIINSYLSKEWVKWGMIVILLVTALYNEIDIYLFEELDMKDIGDFRQGALLLLAGENPYTHEDLWTRNHPPGVFFLYAIILTIGGDNLDSIRFITHAFAWLSAAVLFFITRDLIQIYVKFRESHPNFKENQGFSKDSPNTPIPVQIDPTNYKFMPWLIVAFFFLDPAITDRYGEGSYEIFSSFFLILGFYFLIKNREFFSAINFGISLNIQLVPLFILPILFLYFLQFKDWKRMIKFFAVMMGVVVVSLIPFLIDDFNATLGGLSLLSSRYTSHHSFFWFYPRYYDNFYSPLVQIGPLSFSLWFFLQGTMYGVMLAFIYYFNRKSMSKLSLCLSCFIIYLFMPIMTNSYGIRYLSWIGGLFYIIMVLNKKYPLIIAFYYMSRYFMHYWPVLPKYPFLMVFGAYFFSLILICLLFRELLILKKRDLGT